MLRASHPLEDKPENAQPPHQVVAGKARSIPLPPPFAPIHPIHLYSLLENVFENEWASGCAAGEVRASSRKAKRGV